MKDTLTKLLETGLGRGGKLTYDEVGEKLAALKAGAEQMEEALKYLAEHHVEVVKSIAPVQLSEKINPKLSDLLRRAKGAGISLTTRWAKNSRWSAKPTPNRWKRFSAYSRKTT